MEGLADEVRAGETAMDEAGLATFFGDGSNTGIALQVDSRIPAGAVGTEGDQQAWGEDGAGAGETFKEFVLGMSGKLLRDVLVESCNPADDREELSRLGLDGEAEGIDDSGIVGQGASGTDLRKAFFNPGETAAMMALVKLS